jgi:hypothetical protein
LAQIRGMHVQFLRRRIGAECGGESQQIPHIWLVAPGEPVGHGNNIRMTTP